jgi:DNA recombination protein RmuC
MTEFTVALLFLLLGLIVGGLSAWLIAKYKFAANLLSHADLEAKFVPRAMFDSLQQQSDLLRDDLKEKEEERLVLEKHLTAKERDILYLEEKLANWKKEWETLHSRSQTEFENLANRLLEEKSKKFTAQNEQNLNQLLNPLREKIKEFGLDIERRFTEEAKDMVSLKSEIERLRNLNLQLSSDAQNLASALKGDSKTQGDWGELQLELLLEKAGLSKGLHYLVQPSFKDENGQDKRPDFIIQLPEDKHLVIDSKVSLTAYERFFHAADEKERAACLKDHLDSIRSHIRELNGKNYQHLYQINSPDYLLLFIPVEPAFTLAVQQDSRLFLDALDKNIVIVTTTTLLATMRTVSYIWRQERQKKNVLEIARQSGLLYDKFVGFVDDLKEVGLKLEHAQTALHGAMNKLSDSKKYGDTLVGRAQRIKELGAKTTKALPKEIAGLDDEEPDDFEKEDDQGS